ncbi:MAG: 30S ribosomal protein S4e [Nanoarchaeota archaeon]
MAHLKRYSMPNIWPLSVKDKVWVGKPMPGTHRKDKCITMSILVRNILKYGDSAKETKKLIGEGKILVDKIPRKEPNFPLGFMDIIEIPEIKDYFRVNINNKGLVLEKINSADSEKKMCIILDKTIIKGGKCQLNLHDGKNLIVDKPKTYKTGDTVIIDLTSKKIIKHFQLNKNASALIIDGRNRGLTGKIKEIKERGSVQEKASIIMNIKGKEIETLKKYVMVGDFA